ncbi:hypothetical protein [Chroococcidiopsis sp.]|uniref:hypothetical protein n=1 Tax=Chroococcidiopsis sp. TaxID=3088168 RepID=UPI003F333671
MMYSNYASLQVGVSSLARWKLAEAVSLSRSSSTMLGKRVRKAREKKEAVLTIGRK